MKRKHMIRLTACFTIGLPTFLGLVFDWNTFVFVILGGLITCFTTLFLYPERRIRTSLPSSFPFYRMSPTEEATLHPPHVDDGRALSSLHHLQNPANPISQFLHHQQQQNFTPPPSPTIHDSH